MKIYNHEINDGLESQLRNMSIAFCATPRLAEAFAIDSKVIASRQTDLYYFDSILASVGENLNTDIFTAEELWAARNTPEDKPLNFEHNPTEIIGHIVGNSPVNVDFTEIPDGILPENLPEKFHIKSNAVIYKEIDDEAFREKANRIIAEIPEGKWFVSMECLFRGFDYGVTSPDGESRIVARNESTSFLTKHLRQYGGAGVYNGYTLGRVLRKISFAGKGIVSNPANPESLIINFEQTEPFKGVASNTVLFNINSLNSMEKSDMDAEKLTKQLEAALEDNKALQAKLAENDVKAATAQVESLKVDVTKAAATITEMTNKLTASESLVKDLSEKVTELNGTVATQKTEIAGLNREKVGAARLAALLKSGVDEKEAPKLVDKFADLSDAAFEGVLSLAGMGNTTQCDPAPSSVKKKAKTVKGPGGGQYNTDQYGAKSSDELEDAEETGDITTAAVTETEDEFEATCAEVNDYFAKANKGGFKFKKETK